MKKYLLIFIILPIISFNYCSKNSAYVNIEVTANNLPEGSIIYITGSDPQMGNWQPDSVQLNKSDEGKWVKEFSFGKGKKLEFKITRGNWGTEALNDDGSIPPNYVLEVFSDTSVKININLWADQVEKKVEGQITGTVQYHKDFQGKGIKPRDIIVWLPPNYETDLNKNYPVLYMHDGQNIIDPNTSAFQVDWQIDENADTLIRKGLIEPIIVVGIYNSSDRDNEYAAEPQGILYMNFIVETLKPFIDTNYRTKTDRENTANGGASLGGLISFILTWNHSDVFSKAFCFSPAFKIDNYDFVDNVNDYNGEKKDIKIFINNGDNELDTKLQPGIDEMLNALINQGFTKGNDYYFFNAKNSLHGERDWSINIWRSLIFLFGTEKGRNLI